MARALVALVAAVLVLGPSAHAQVKPESAPRDSPPGAPAWTVDRRGVLELLRQGQHEQAIRAADAFVARHPLSNETFSVLLIKAESQYRLSRVDDAIHTYQQAMPFIQQLGNVGQRRFVMAFFRLGLLYRRKAQYDTAIRFVEASRPASPASPRTHTTRSSSASCCARAATRIRLSNTSRRCSAHRPRRPRTRHQWRQGGSLGTRPLPAPGEHPPHQRPHPILIGLTDRDIFGPDTNFVFSWQAPTAGLGVLSTHRFLAGLDDFYEPGVIGTRRVGVQLLSTSGSLLGFARPGLSARLSARLPGVPVEGNEAVRVRDAAARRPAEDAGRGQHSVRDPEERRDQPGVPQVLLRLAHREATVSGGLVRGSAWPGSTCRGRST